MRTDGASAAMPRPKRRSTPGTGKESPKDGTAIPVRDGSGQTAIQLWSMSAGKVSSSGGRRAPSPQSPIAESSGSVLVSNPNCCDHGGRQMLDTIAHWPGRGDSVPLAWMSEAIAVTEIVEPPLRAAAATLGYDREAVALLGLSRLKGVGFQTLTRLGGRPGISALLESKSVKNVIEKLSEAGARLGSEISPAEPWDKFRERLWCVGLEVVRPLVDRKIRFLFRNDPKFPWRVAEMPDAIRPDWLFIAGNLELLDRPSLAIVGTREPSPNGEFLARYAVSCAQMLGAPVVSGLAQGIDRLVHEWCLHVSLPTISVLGTGILVPYPARHAPLSDAIIAAGGALVSEYMPDQQPLGQQFVWRNRLQAALGRATIPVEWRQKSGTAHTVRFSRKLARPVIGMDLGGVARQSDAGEADLQFQVPANHSDLLDALRKALIAGVSLQDARQPDLFG
jgi:DNA processing protein